MRINERNEDREKRAEIKERRGGNGKKGNAN
jgi:hypothetical protein